VLPRPDPRTLAPPRGGVDELLTVADVMQLLRLADRRAARRYMLEAGGFRLDRDYRVRRSRLGAWIDQREALAEPRLTPPAGGPRRRVASAREVDWRTYVGGLAR
jgi:hypothetical protein